MTFEASAKLEVSCPSRSLESTLPAAIGDREFLSSLLKPLVAQVRRHFALEAGAGAK